MHEKSGLVGRTIIMPELLCLHIINQLPHYKAKCTQRVKTGLLNSWSQHLDPTMYALFRAVDINVGCPLWGGMSPTSPSKLRALRITRFNSLPIVSQEYSKINPRLTQTGRITVIRLYLSERLALLGIMKTQLETLRPLGPSKHSRIERFKVAVM